LSYLNECMLAKITIFLHHKHFNKTIQTQIIICLLIIISLISQVTLAFNYFCDEISNQIINWLKTKNINLKSFSMTGQVK
jgi:hypothetical protein